MTDPATTNAGPRSLNPDMTPPFPRAPHPLPPPLRYLTVDPNTPVFNALAAEWTATGRALPGNAPRHRRLIVPGAPSSPMPGTPDAGTL
ncbi:hypothetical protein [Streptodolium elevatio]